MASNPLSYDYVDNRYLDDNGSNHDGNNGYPPDYGFQEIANEIDITVLTNRVQALEDKVKLEMDSLNAEIDEVRAGHVDCLSMNGHANHRCDSLQVNFNKLSSEMIYLKKSFGSLFGFITGIAVAGVAFAGACWFGSVK